jgi:hypothetical protein
LIVLPFATFCRAGRTRRAPRFLTWIPLAGIILAFPLSVLAQSAAAPIVPPAWPVSSAPARFVIQPDEAGPALLSCVYLDLPQPKWAAMAIRVFTDTGTAVGCNVLWSTPGGPATLIFDSSSGARHYQVYLGSDWPVLPLSDKKAGVWLESRPGDGKIIDHLPDMLQAWNQSGKVNGRALLPGIYEGGNRFGPQGNLFEHFQGWFDVAAPEHLQLATMSTDASFVLVDGKEAVEWPGRHNCWHPTPGERPRGDVDLTPGLHRIDYYNAFVLETGNSSLVCSLAAKGGPLADWTMLKPGNSFFRPVARDHAVSYELQTGSVSPLGAVPALAIDWMIKDQSVISSDVSDSGFISLQLTCLAQTAGTLTWTFDDGSTAQGPSIRHLFPRPGMRTVRLSLADGEKQLASLTQTIDVHPGRADEVDQHPLLRADHEADILGRDPATFSASDLAGCLAIFDAYGQPDDLLKLLPAVCARMKDVDEADLPYVRDAALSLVRDDRSHFSEESQLLQALVDRCTTPQPSPPLITIGSQCRLALAQLTLETSDHTDDVRSLIDGIDVKALSGDEPRRLGILRADLAWATGDIAGARKEYQALTGNPIGPDARSSIRRTAKIGQARAFIDRKDFDAAETSLNEVTWQSPLEKMSPDWALTRLRLYQEENLPGAAYLWAKRLLPVITGGGRSELLFRTTGLAFSQSDGGLAQKTLAELLKNHPYSEEAAQAKEKWPGQRLAPMSNSPINGGFDP